MYRTCLLGALLLAIGGCASNAERIDAQARAAGLTRTVLESDGLPTLIYSKAGPSDSGRLLVFLEGDGRPWHAGIEPSADPTTRNPIALQLMQRTPGNAAYVGRPCYHNLGGERCTSDLWTSARYSEEVVHAMANAVREAARRANARDIVLVGYSGGGALAVLLAERLETITAVVTIAANLDIDAWTRHHGYLPLDRSLNPATSSHAHPWREIHLLGMRDTTVPPVTADAYFQRYPHTQRWTFDEHGHVCCWLDAWPALWQKIAAALPTAE